MPPKKHNTSSSQIANALQANRELERILKKLATYPAVSAAILGSMPVAVVAGSALMRLEQYQQEHPAEPKVSLTLQLIIYLTQLGCMPILRNRIMHRFPHSIFNPLQTNPIQAQETLQKQSGYLDERKLREITLDLQQETRVLQRHEWTPAKIFISVIIFYFIFLWIWTTFISREKPNSLLFIIPEIVLNGSFLGGAVARSWWAIESTYKAWNSKDLNTQTLKELNEYLHPGHHAWAASNINDELNVFGISYKNEEITVKLSSEESITISNIEYFRAVGQAMNEFETKLLVARDEDLSVSNDIARIGILNIQKRTLELLERHSTQQKQARKIKTDLNYLNKIHEIETSWEYAVENEQMVFYLELSVEEWRHDVIQKLGENYGLQLNVIENNYRIILNNPEYKNFSAGSATRAQYNSQDYTPPRMIHHRKTFDASTVEVPVAIPRPQIVINFLRAGLLYNSNLYDETTALIRPMYAPWLPDCVCFSYLAPEVISLLTPLELNQISNLLKSGRVYPAGILKGAAGGVGIVQAKQVYNSVIDGKAYISDYKIKTSTNRYHGRLYEENGRYKLYRFDGISGHGH